MRDYRKLQRKLNYLQPLYTEIVVISILLYLFPYISEVVEVLKMFQEKQIKVFRVLKVLLG